MQNTLTFGKKAFTWTVVVATIAWAMSAAFIAIPLTASAATMAGDLIVGTARSTSGPGRPVYYVGSDMKKYLFPSSKTYTSWYGTSFSAVKELAQSEVDALVTGDKNATAKPGSCVSFVNENAVYVVDGTSRRLADATVCPAASTYSIPEGFRTNYSAGTAFSGGSTAAAALGTAATSLGTVLGLSATAVVVTPTGALAVAVASDSPAAAVVPGGATSVVTLKFNVTAGATAQTVTGVTVKSVGVGSANDFSAVYLYDGATRLTSGRTLTSQTRQAEFAALNIAVAANTTKTLSVVVDVNSLTTGTLAVAGDTHAFQVTALATTASVSGLPVTGASNSIGSQGVSTVILVRGSDPANPTIGQTGVAIGEFRLTAGVNDVELRRAVVTVGGTVTVSDLSAFALYQGATKLADGTVVSDRVTFDLSGTPYALSQGTNRLFTVKANVAGRGSRTIATYIDSTYPSDLLVVDKLYGYGATTTFTSFSAVATAASTPATGGSFVTTQGGRVTVAFNGPSASDVSLGSQDVTMYKFSLTAGDQALDVREVELTLTEAPTATAVAGRLRNAAATTNYFTDVKIKDADTGAILMGPVELSGATFPAGDTNGTSATVLSTATWDNDFTQSWTLDAGKTRNLVVTMDIASSETTANDLTTRGFAVTLNAFPAGSIREVSTNQNIATTDIVGGQSAVTGNTMTVRASSLTVQLASTPISGSTVKGSTGVEAAGLSFAAGVQSDIKITQVILTGMGGTTAGTYTNAMLDDVVITAQLFDGTTAVSTAKTPNSTTGALTFDNMNWTLPAGTTRKLTVRTNLATTLQDSNTDYFWLGINAAADITAQDKDSNTVTATDGDATWSGPINGTATTATVLETVLNSGTLTVSQGDTPLAAIVTGGTSNVTATKVSFLPAFESFKIKRLRVTNEGTDSAGTACDGTETTAENASACDNAVAQVKLTYPILNTDGTIGTETKTGVLSAGIADFNDLNFYAKNETTSVLTIATDLATISTSAVSGDQLDFGIDFDSNFEAVGVGAGTSGSGTTLSTCAGLTAGSGLTCATASATVVGTDISGNALTVRKTKPTVTLSSASAGGAKSPSSNLEVIRFTVAADVGGSIDLARATFRVNATDNGTNDWNQPRDAAAAATQAQCEVGGTTPTCATADSAAAGSLEASDFHIYDASDTNTELGGTWTLWDASGTTLDADEDVGFARFDFDRDDVTDTLHRQIDASGSKTYVVYMNLLGVTTGTNGDRISLDIVADTSDTLANLDASPADDAARGSQFVWGEVGTGAVAAVRATPAGITGNNVKNLTVTGNTLTF